MKVNARRRLFVITIMATAILAVAYGFMPRPVSVDVVKAAHGLLRVTIEEEGMTRVKDRFIISSPVNGYKRRIELEVGDLVKKGQAVAVLEPGWPEVLDTRSRAEAEASVSAALAELHSARENSRAAAADAEYSRQKLGRNRKLYEEGYIARDLLEQTEADAKRTEANRLSADAVVKTARFELQRARAALRYSAVGKRADHEEIVAVHTPVSGRVLKIHRESEGAVNAGEPLIDIGDPSSLEVKVEVLSADAVKIRPGTSVIFERWGGDKPLKGKVKTIEPAALTKISSLGVEEQRVLVIADITSIPEIWQRLGDGYRVEASFIIWEGDDVLKVPSSSLFRRAGGWAVFVIKDRKAHMREISVGHRNGLEAEIISGVSEGEMVIINPDDSVSDGGRVRIR